MSLGDLEWYLNVMISNEGGLKKQGKESVLKLEEKYEKMFGPQNQKPNSFVESLLCEKLALTTDASLFHRKKPRLFAHLLTNKVPRTTTADFA